MKIALAQINPTVGDFTGNTQKILDFAARAAEAGARLTIFPELALCGYPPADFLEKPSFLARSEQGIEELRKASSQLEMAILFGTPRPTPAGYQDTGRHAINAAILVDKGELLLTQPKRLLPFYDVFDEQRYFAPGLSQQRITLDGEDLAITVCEDAWNDKDFWPRRLYPTDPVEDLLQAGPAILLNISASPYWNNKRETRREMLSAIAKRHSVPVLLVNQVGGNDSLVFDGTSLALDARGNVIAEGKSFAEDLILIDTAVQAAAITTNYEGLEADYNALVLGTRDYLRKCGFKKALLGLSGGIDSALVAAIARDAVGAENVLAIGMPSPYSSEGSIEDSHQLAKNLGIRFETIAIGPLFEQFNTALGPLFAGTKPDLTEENIQSRIRGNLLMALSNKTGALVLTTGNKSEMSVGYCTLYGDMVGALAVIGDLVKTRVYEICHWLNRNGEVIPEVILTKAPSAELRPDQKDTDSLPPYEVLDPIVESYIERYQTPEQIAAANGFDLALVQHIVRLIERSEYKRQQAAPVLKLTSKSFGMGRRFPIAVRVQV